MKGHWRSKNWPLSSRVFIGLKMQETKINLLTQKRQILLDQFFLGLFDPPVDQNILVQFSFRYQKLNSDDLNVPKYAQSVFWIQYTNWRLAPVSGHPRPIVFNMSSENRYLRFFWYTKKFKLQIRILISNPSNLPVFV